ncbi:MAG TPA: CBS domain-containing protein [Streptosporangiaceae bacterium]|nr:CBS domain-containing protein [Streptosporangiaceae bacterium]
MAESPRPRGSSVVTLRDLMHTSVVMATPETTVANAAAAMVRARVGSAVVMQASFLAGILTERDVLRAAASGEDLCGSLVADWMTPDPQSVSPDTAVEDAAQIMLLHGFRHLPVVESREVRGVVSLRDLFAARIRRPGVPAAARSAAPDSVA